MQASQPQKNPQTCRASAGYSERVSASALRRPPGQEERTGTNNIEAGLPGPAQKYPQRWNLNKPLSCGQQIRVGLQRQPQPEINRQYHCRRLGLIVEDHAHQLSLLLCRQEPSLAQTQHLCAFVDDLLQKGKKYIEHGVDPSGQGSRPRDFLFEEKICIRCKSHLQQHC